MNSVCIIIGLLLIADTAFIMTKSNLNVGVIMPALLGTPILFFGLFCKPLLNWFSSGLGKLVFIAAICCYFGYVILIVICIILIAIAERKKITVDPDAIIVLGAAVRGTSPSLAMINRLEAVYNYWINNRTLFIVVSGGQSGQEKISEADAMYTYLINKGVPSEKIIKENKSESTLENFMFSDNELKKIFPSGYEAVFVTNKYHIFRAGLAAKAAGVKADGIGCGSKFYIVPNNYLREALAILRYFLLGLRGNIT